MSGHERLVADLLIFASVLPVASLLGIVACTHRSTIYRCFPWRREPLINRLELSEDGELALPDRSRAISTVVMRSEQSMTSPNFHFEKVTSGRGSTSATPRAITKRKSDLESHAI